MNCVTNIRKISDNQKEYVNKLQSNRNFIVNDKLGCQNTINGKWNNN